jgi:hypothetical protein
LIKDFVNQIKMFAVINNNVIRKLCKISENITKKSI